MLLRSSVSLVPPWSSACKLVMISNCSPGLWLAGRPARKVEARGEGGRACGAARRGPDDLPHIQLAARRGPEHSHWPPARPPKLSRSLALPQCDTRVTVTGQRGRRPLASAHAFLTNRRAARLTFGQIARQRKSSSFRRIFSPKQARERAHLRPPDSIEKTSIFIMSHERLCLHGTRPQARALSPRPAPLSFAFAHLKSIQPEARQHR